MASRLRRGQQGLQQPHGTQKARKDYVSALEKELKQLMQDLEGGGSAGGQLTRRKKDKEKEKQQSDIKKRGKGQARLIVDKIRQGHGGSDQQQTKQVVDEYKKQKKALHQENEQLTLIAEHLQEASTATSLRFQEEIQSLQDQLMLAEESRMTGLVDFDDLLHVNSSIQDEISRLRGVAEKQAVDEKEVMETSFVKQIEAKVHELATEKKQRKNNTGEWLVKNRILQDEVNRRLIATEAKHRTAKQLNETRKALHVEYTAQLEDKQFLLNQMTSIEKHNQRLRDRVVELEAQLHSMQHKRQVQGLAATDPGPRGVGIGSDMVTPRAAGTAVSAARSARGARTTSPRSPTSPLSDTNPDLVISRSELDTVLANPTYDDKARSEYDRFQRYESILQKSTQLLELERRNLKGVRAAHLAALSQRTELEVFLKEAVSWGTDEARKRRPDADGTPTLNEADRRAIVERLLSKDRVLELLYGADTGADEAQPAPQASLSPELDMNELWEKWKMWTDNAK